MKKVLLGLLLAPLLSYAEVKAVIFDWGDVLASPDRQCVVDYLCQSLNLSVDEMEAANLEKRKAVKTGLSDVDFWCQFAKDKKIEMAQEWAQGYRNAIKQSLGVDSQMYALVDELKAKGVMVGLLSNIDTPYVKLIRQYGLYDLFDPCLLSCDIGVNKPNCEAYHVLLDKVPFAPADIIFIDDKLENIEAAKEAGIDGICFESEAQIRVELNKRGLQF